MDTALVSGGAKALVSFIAQALAEHQFSMNGNSNQYL
jgi:hypothetical protein